MSLVLFTPPAIEPVTVDEAKTWLRVDHDSDNVIIAILIKAARICVERTLRRALVEQTWDLVMDEFPGERFIEIPKPPLKSVTHVKYIDVNGAEQTFGSGNYIVDTGATPGRIALQPTAEWPSTKDTIKVATIRFVCGATVTAGSVSIPEDYKVALLLKLSEFYESRQAAFEELLKAERLYSF